MKKLLLYYHTIRHLKFIQVRYQLYYILRRKLGWRARLGEEQPTSTGAHLQLAPSIIDAQRYQSPRSFEFLNIEHTFQNKIDWNEPSYGKLWTYNLNYFEYLGQEDMNRADGLALINDFIANSDTLKDGLEPFPIALRVMNWVKFVTKHQIQDGRINQSLCQQMHLLTKQVEYHLMGNHLLENGFALLFGAYYFKNEHWLDLANGILSEQLEEQILPDGAHFELAPMYHQLMLYRVLDCYNLVANNRAVFTIKLEAILYEKASQMLGWLGAMQMSDGTIPQLNDSARGIAPSPQALFQYAHDLSILYKKSLLKASGYRVHQSKIYEVLVDIGKIGPDYIPGHAHSDTLNFVMHHQSRPLIVDTGISTYEKNARRTLERSTAAHNTVQINGAEQSEVWGGFRVARRANITDFSESETAISATHDGYASAGIYHERTFKWQSRGCRIEDQAPMAKNACAYFHFHPNIEIKLAELVLSGDFGQLHFENAQRIELEEYDYALGFNKTQKGKVAVVYFDDYLVSIFELNENLISN